MQAGMIFQVTVLPAPMNHTPDVLSIDPWTFAQYPAVTLFAGDFVSAAETA